MNHIAISGDIGSGKSSVAELLSRLLHWQVARAGEMQRSTAASFGLTTLQANRLAEAEPALDEKIDNRLMALGKSQDEMIFDSRIAWHLIPDAFKVHLIADPEVAARRVLKRSISAVERYTTLAEAIKAAEERYQSERSRFAAELCVLQSREVNCILHSLVRHQTILQLGTSSGNAKLLHRNKIHRAIALPNPRSLIQACNY